MFQKLLFRKIVFSYFCKDTLSSFVNNSNFLKVSSRSFQSRPTLFAGGRYYPNNNSRYYLYKKKGYVEQLYDAFLILDFEATCQEGFGSLKEQEIIEFPCLWMDSRTLEVTSEFHRYVKPKISENLDPFCVSLTGINDDVLSDQPNFEVVLNDFLDWLEQQKKVNNAQKTVFITSGDWDLKIMLPLQCHLSKIPIPPQMKRWINVKEAFCCSTGTYPNGIKHMLQMLNVTHVGRLHSGIDDCTNIAAIVKKLGESGYVFGTDSS